MKKQNNQKEQRQNLVLNRETVRKLDDEALQSVAGGCYRMPITCTCPFEL
jgi:hypothetical protein